MLLYITIFFMVLKYMQTPNLPTLINKINLIINFLEYFKNKPIITPLCELYKSYNTLSIPNLHKYQLLGLISFDVT